jgi:hypothetical protein
MFSMQLEQKNIPLENASWGDGTELNPYSYYNPIEQTSERRCSSGYTTDTRQFKEDFISIEWVTPQFEFFYLAIFKAVLRLIGLI